MKDSFGRISKSFEQIKYSFGPPILSKYHYACINMIKSLKDNSRDM